MEKGKVKENQANEITENSREDINEDKEGIGRSFECNFCKRGFTNAQALGGHMNIHRKDKLPNKSESKQPSNFSHKLDHLSIHSTSYNYHFTHPSPYHQSNHHTVYHHPYGCLNGSDLGAHLSSRVSSSRVDNGHDGNKKDSNDDALDLELRLGRNP